MDTLKTFDSPYLQNLVASNSYFLALHGTVGNPPPHAAQQKTMFTNRLMVENGLESYAWLVAQTGNELVAVYSCGELLSGVRPGIIHGAVTAYFMDEVIGGTVHLVSRLVGKKEVSFMTRSLTTDYLKPVPIPGKYAVLATMDDKEQLKDLDKVKNVTVEAKMYKLDDFVDWRSGKASEPKALAAGTGRFAKVDVAAMLKKMNGNARM